MSRIRNSNMLPASSKLTGIYRGVVENNRDWESCKDGKKMGRCQIRIFGLHDPNKTNIPTEALPWAQPCLSLFGGSITGVGSFTVPNQGAHVFVFFENGHINQPRFFATAPGLPTKPSASSEGFNDPDMVFPIPELLNEPDFNRLARDVSAGTIVDTKQANLIKNVQTSSGISWSEPDSFYKDTAEHYPDNTVIATANDLILELDDTDDFVRFHLYHPSNSYLEINKDGKLVLRNKDNQYILVGKSQYVFVNNDQNVTVNGKATRLIKSDEIELIAGNKKSYVTSDETKSITGKQTTSVQDNVVHSSGGSQTIVSSSGQSIVTKGSQSVSTYGNQTVASKGAQSVSTLGNQSFSAMGLRNDSIMGMRSVSVMGIEKRSGATIGTENYMGVKQISGTVGTHLGPSPLGKILNSVKAAEAGFVGAVQETMKPVMDAMKSITDTVNGTINEAISMVNTVTQPITDVLNQTLGVVNYVRNEVNTAQQLFTTVTNAPFLVVNTLSNYANRIISFPGTLAQNVVNRIRALPTSLNMIRSLSSIYTTSMSTANTIMSMQTQVSNLSTMYNSLLTYNTTNLNQYGNSGIFSLQTLASSLTDPYVTASDPTHYYVYANDSAGPTTAATAYSDPPSACTFAEELNLIMTSATTMLSASAFDETGVFQMEQAIQKTFDGHEASVLVWFKANVPLSAYLNPVGVQLNSTDLFDADSLNTVGDVMMDSNITVALSGGNMDSTINQILLLGNDSASEIINSSIEAYLKPYIHAFSQKLENEMIQMFEMLISFETEMQPTLSSMSDLTNADWQGKSDAIDVILAQAEGNQ